MSTSDDTASEPALLRIVRSDRHHHAQPARGLQTQINLSIAQKLEQLGAEGRGQRRYKSAGDRGRRPRLLGRRRFADHWSCGRQRHHRAGGRGIAQALPRLYRDRAADAEDVLSSVHGSAAGAGMGLAWSLTFASPPPTPASRRPTQDRRLAGWRQYGRHGRYRRHPPGAAGISRADSFTAQQAYEWGLVARVVPAADLKAETRKFEPSVWRRTRRPPSQAPSRCIYQAAERRPGQQLDAEEKGIIDAMHTDDFRIAVKKFTSKSKGWDAVADAVARLSLPAPWRLPTGIGRAGFRAAPTFR